MKLLSSQRSTTLNSRLCHYCLRNSQQRSTADYAITVFATVNNVPRKTVITVFTTFDGRLSLLPEKVARRKDTWTEPSNTVISFIHSLHFKSFVLPSSISLLLWSAMGLDSVQLIPGFQSCFNKLPWIHCHPFRWPETDMAPHRRTEPSVLLHFYVNVGLAVAYLCFVLYRTQEVFCDPNPNLEQQLYMALMTSLYAFIVLCFYLPLCQPNEFIQFQRSHIKFISSGKVLQ